MSPAPAVVSEEKSPDPPVHSDDTEEGRGEREGGRWGVDRGREKRVTRSVSDDRVTSQHHPSQETDST